MAMNRIVTTLPAVNGGADFAILVGKSDVFPYENGKKVSDTRTGVRLNLALQGNSFSPLSVKFDHDPLPKITSEQLQNACADCKFALVKIGDCEVVIYTTANGMGMTATATAVQLCDQNGRPLQESGAKMKI